MSRRILPLTLASLLIAGGAVTAWYSTRPASDGPSPALPTHPAAAQEVLFAQPFVLDVPYTHWYRLEQPQVNAGWLLVLKVDPELALPRQSVEPVLYVGEQTAERWNSAQPTGYLVVTVPSGLDATGAPADVWSEQPIWFGTAELPERIDAPRIAQELAAAHAEGIGSLPPSVVQIALAEGGHTLHLKNRDALQPVVADLIERFSPTETDRIEGLRVPVHR